MSTDKLTQINAIRRAISASSLLLLPEGGASDGWPCWMRCDVFVVTGESSFEGVYKFRVSSFLARQTPLPHLLPAAPSSLLSPRLVIYHFVRRCATPAEYLVAGTARRGKRGRLFVPIPASVLSRDRSRDRASSI